MVVFLTFQATTMQGIDYKVRSESLPLHLKIFDFFNRHYHYKLLANAIIGSAKTGEEKVLAILKWTYANIKRQPKELPVIDDHVWHIIIRGYGVDDQFQDVFSTLCNYAGIPAFLTTVKSSENGDEKWLSFVKLKNGWTVFDSYNGIYFKTDTGAIAYLDDIQSGNWTTISIAADKKMNYNKYISGMKNINYENWKYSRPAIQSPIRRVLFWLKYKN